MSMDIILPYVVLGLLSLRHIGLVFVKFTGGNPLTTQRK